MNGQYGAWHTRGLQVGVEFLGLRDLLTHLTASKLHTFSQEGEDARYVKTAVTLKHWDAYSLEDSDGFTRNDFNAIVRCCFPFD
jgi:hypothetical protein